MTMQKADVNGIKIAFDVRGSGPPLVLIMGYRLSSGAWPSSFIDGLSKRFTLILFDNRGTGLSDKPTFGYALSNMAKDVCGLMDHLGIRRASILGYSMGGAVAQELVCQFPRRVSALVLCATLCGGPRAVYAKPAVFSVMHDLDGLDPMTIARRIWTVTYEPKYLEANIDKIEQQMRRELKSCTPLHAADLQLQAFVDFDSSQRLSQVRAPTMVMTGDRDVLIPPRNSELLAGLVPGALLTVIPGCAHRIVWEATDECVMLISDFLAQARGETDAAVTKAV
jgi:pimeloyl-ACP methyl ester carboxylesterase